MVAAAAQDRSGLFVASVTADGTTTRSLFPCPQRPVDDILGAGIMAVPGATLVLCPPPDGGWGAWNALGLGTRGAGD